MKNDFLVLLEHYKKGYIDKTEFTSIINQEPLDFFISNIVNNEYGDYFEELVDILKSIYEVYLFCFPVAGVYSYLNYGALIKVTDNLKIETNHKDQGVIKNINSLLKDKHVFVLFKNIDFKGSSFSGSMMACYNISKDINQIGISFIVDNNLNIKPVSNLDRKYIVSKSNSKPFISHLHIKNFDDAIKLISQNLEVISYYKDIKEFKISIDKNYLALSNDQYQLNEICLGIAKYLHQEGLPIAIIKDFDIGTKEVFKMIDYSAIKRYETDRFIVFTDALDIIDLESISNLELINSDEYSSTLYMIIDNYIRKSLKHFHNSTYIIRSLIELIHYYGDFGIPQEKIDLDEPPSFLLLDNMRYLFKNNLIKSYFLARAFVENKAKIEFNEQIYRFIIFHPEFETLNKKLRKKILYDFYTGNLFRSIYKDEYEIFLKMAKELLPDIFLYESVKKFYQEGEYKKAIEYIKQQKAINQRLDIILTNILIDLWAFDNIENKIENLNTKEYKKLGQFIYIYLKKMDIDKALKISEKKLSHKDDNQRYAYHLLVLSYSYRLNPSNSLKKELISIYENYLKEIEINIVKGFNNYFDKIYLMRNFSYALIPHKSLEEAYTKIDKLDTINPLYPLLINIAFMQKNKELLTYLSDERFFSKQPIENIACILAYYELTKDSKYIDMAISRYENVIKSFNIILEPINLKTEFKLSNDLHNIFTRLVYIQ